VSMNKWSLICSTFLGYKSPPFHTYVLRIHLISLSYHILVICHNLSSMEQMLILMLILLYIILVSCQCCSQGQNPKAKDKARPGPSRTRPRPRPGLSRPRPRSRSGPSRPRPRPELLSPRPISRPNMTHNLMPIYPTPLTWRLHQSVSHSRLLIHD